MSFCGDDCSDFGRKEDTKATYPILALIESIPRNAAQESYFATATRFKRDGRLLLTSPCSDCLKRPYKMSFWALDSGNVLTSFVAELKSIASCAMFVPVLSNDVRKHNTVSMSFIG